VSERAEPLWLTRDLLDVLHARQIELFGGLHGVRDSGAIDSALARPRNAWTYGEAGDVETVTAVYLHALSRQQGYLDGNKRAALAGALIFLHLNGRTLTAPPDELYAAVIGSATDEMPVARLAEWIRRHI
jgi:death on curing protein